MSRQLRLRMAVAGVALCAVGALVWLLWSGAARRTDALDRLALEGGELGGRGLAAVMRIELDAVLDLLEAAGHSRPSGVALRAMLPAALPLAGVDLSRDVDTALVLVPTGGAAADLALVLTGRFDPAAVRAAASGTVAAPAGAGDAVAEVLHRRARDCRETRWGLAVNDGRVLVAARDWIDAVLPEVDALLEGVGSSSGSLARLRDRAAGRRLVRASLSGPLSRPEEAPATAALLELVERWKGQARRARLELDRGSMAGALELALDLELAEGSAADARAAGLELALRTGAARLGALHPALGSWADVAGIRARGSRVFLTASRSRDAAAELAELPAALLLLAAAGQVEGAAARGAPSGEVEIDPWPLPFAEHFSLDSVPDYRSGMPLAGETDAAAGPFGIRVERVAGRAADDGLEVTLRAVGPELPNLSRGRLEPRLIVERVEDAQGAELRAPADCGPSRPGVGAPLRREPLAEIREARYPLRLRPDVAVDRVARVAGTVELELPTRIRRERLSSPAAGKRLELGDGGLELIAASSAGFAYRTRGDATDLIEVRGLDARGLPLQVRRHWERALPGGRSVVGVRHHAGGLAYVEAVFALETRASSFAFELASARPGTRGEALHVESSSFVRYSLEQFDREFGRVPAERWPDGRAFLAVAQAGPFSVAVDSLGDDGHIAPELRVLVPDVPNLTYDAAALELVVHRVRLADGREVTPPGAQAWRRRLVPGYARHGRGLEGVVRVDLGADATAAVSRIDGEIRLRPANDVAVAELVAVEPGQTARAAGVGLELVELGRDQLQVRLSGALDRIFSLRAFGAHGQELALADIALDAAAGEGPVELDVEVHGQAHRVALQAATGRGLRRQAFSLALPAALPAAEASPEP